MVAFDAFGHGESPGDSMSIPELANCIRQVSDELGGLYGVVAHSMGGAATTVALANGLELERAVFISPPADPREFLRIFGDALAISEEVRAHMKERVERRLGMTMESMRATTIAPSMHVPLLVVHDRDDKEVPVDSGQSIAEAWPNAELMLTEGLGHQRILRAEPVTNVAVSFIDALSIGSTRHESGKAENHDYRNQRPAVRDRRERNRRLHRVARRVLRAEPPGKPQSTRWSPSMRLSRLPTE